MSHSAFVDDAANRVHVGPFVVGGPSRARSRAILAAAGFSDPGEALLLKALLHIPAHTSLKRSKGQNKGNRAQVHVHDQKRRACRLASMVAPPQGWISIVPHLGSFDRP